MNLLHTHTQKLVAQAYLIHTPKVTDFNTLINSFIISDIELDTLS